MKKSVGITALVFVLIGGVAVAQQSTPSPAPGQGSGHSMPHGMMCPMMGGMMSGGMMSGGMMSGGTENPRMVQMRGEMLKAMGEVMVKYGKLMETTK